MNPEYRKQLINWGIGVLAMIAVAVLLALVQRWLGVNIQLPPMPLGFLFSPARAREGGEGTVTIGLFFDDAVQALFAVIVVGVLASVIGVFVFRSVSKPKVN